MANQYAATVPPRILPNISSPDTLKIVPSALLQTQVIVYGRIPWVVTIGAVNRKWSRRWLSKPMLFVFFYRSSPLAYPVFILPCSTHGYRRRPGANRTQCCASQKPVRSRLQCSRPWTCHSLSGSMTTQPKRGVPWSIPLTIDAARGF